jgi:hypothetical protein
MLRLTWQMSERNKISVYYDEIDKFRGHGMNAGDDPRTASQIWTSPIYNDAALKWTNTASSRLMLEGGFSFNYEQYFITNQPGVNKEYGTPEWFAGASRRDADLGTLTSGLANWGGRYPDRYNLQGGLSFVTGAHNFKTGIQYNWGPYENTRETNADLQQVYRSGRPTEVVLYNTPVRSLERLNADIGIYAQDTWVFNRLTLNGGIRWEYLSHEVAEQVSGQGRWVPERHFDRIPMPTWKDWAPRFGVVYDLFGNSKTALKFGLNRYNESRTTQFASRYNPNALNAAATGTIGWTDVNGDDIAQGVMGCVYLQPGCEMNFAQLPANFGTAQLNRVDPDFKRTYNVETTVGVQHELFPRVSVAGNWYRRTFHRLRVTDNVLRTMDDYIPIDIFNPLDGEAFTIYTVNPAVQRLVDSLDTNAGSDRKQIYTGFDLNVNARLPGGAMIFGGYVAERTLRVICDEPDNPNLLRFCDDRENDIPYRGTLKLSGTYPGPWGTQISAAIQSLAGRPLGGFTANTVVNKISGPGYGDIGSPIGTEWAITRTLRYPANCPAPCPANALVAPTLTETSLTVPLTVPGTEFLPRLTQLDLSLGKWFQVGGYRLQGQMDIFNVFNKSTVLSYRSTNFLTPSYLQPSSVLQGRILRLGFQMRW